MMSRSISLILAATLSLAGYTMAPGQDAQPAGTPPSADIGSLKAENAKLKKEVSDAAKTIADLQAKLAQSNAQLDAATAAVAAANSAVAAANSAAAAAKSQPALTAPAVADNAASDATPSGPQKALPLDSTNVVTTPGAPGADAGKTYTVVKGDSLWKIAHKMYPHDTANGEDKIRDANKDVFNGKFLQPGQVLVIPQ